MMKNILLITFLLWILEASSQTNYNSVAFYTTQSDLPFGKLKGLFRDDLHPGLEAARTHILRQKEKHDLMLQFKLGYFFHRFVQHAVYFNVDMGYRYKVKSFGFETFFGAGLLQSIPATDKLKLDANGEYKNNRGIGRLQCSANLGLGLSYKIRSEALGDLRLFTRYEQKLQFPFINSYVPLLPYNSFMVGGEWPINKKR